MPQEKLCFSNSDGWIVSISSATTEFSGDLIIERGTVKSPADELTLFLEAGQVGIGASCMPGQSGKVYVTRVKKLDASWMTEGDTAPSNLYTVAYVDVNQEGTSYTPVVELTKSKDMTTVGTKDGCAVVYRGVFRQKTLISPVGAHL